MAFFPSSKKALQEENELLRGRLQEAHEVAENLWSEWIKVSRENQRLRATIKNLRGEK